MGTSLYRRQRFHPSVIQAAIRLFYRFTLSYRDVEELFAERGIDVSFETFRWWCLKFGPIYTRRMRWERNRPSSVWHIDEVFLRSPAATTTPDGRSTRKAKCGTY